MKIIIGLGNPGDKYKKTRHNAGFMAVDYLAEKLGLVWEKNKKMKAEIAKGGSIMLAKPETFMNESGISAAAMLSFYNLLPKKLGLITKRQSDLTEILTVIHDDLDIDLGKIKIALDSRAGGHNGVQSLIDYLKTKKFKRIRIGIRTENKEKIPANKFVLGNFSKEEEEKIKNILPLITDNL